MKRTLKHTLAFALIAVFAILGLGSMATTGSNYLGSTFTNAFASALFSALGSALVGGDSSSSSGTSGFGSSSTSWQKSLVYIVNNTGNQIDWLYIRASDDTEWSTAHSTSLSNDETLNLTYTHSGSYFDLRLVAANGTTYIKGNIRIYDGVTVNFTAGDRG